MALRHWVAKLQVRTGPFQLDIHKRSMPGLQTDMAAAQAEERRREKEAARVRRERLAAARDIELNSEAPNLPAEARPSAEEVAAARAMREQVRTAVMQLAA